MTVDVFEEVVLLAQRARELALGSEPLMPLREEDKPTTTAIREYKEGVISEEDLWEGLQQALSGNLRRPPPPVREVVSSGLESDLTFESMEEKRGTS